MTTAADVQIFISYALEDADHLEELITVLRPSVRMRQVQLWSRRDLLPGQDAPCVVAKQIAAAHVVVLLLSAEYIASDDHYGEALQAIEAQVRNEVSVIAVHLSPFLLPPGDPLGRVQVTLPPPPSVVTEYDTRASAWVDVAAGILAAVHRQVVDLSAVPLPQRRIEPLDSIGDSPFVATHLPPFTPSCNRRVQGETPDTPARVFISCRSDDSESLQTATYFYEALLAAGARPFLASRSVANSAHWIRDVSDALRGSEAFLLLLSSQDAVSQMVAAELDLALQLASSGAGRPYILPVRIRLPASGAENHPLHERLQDLEHASWQGAPDTAAVVTLLLTRIAPGGPWPPATTTAASQTSTASSDAEVAPTTPPPRLLELPGGSVGRRSPFYVTRPFVDEACLREVVRPGALIRIKGPRQMGKSSLMMGLAEHAVQSGARTVTVNLQMADAAMLGDLYRLLRWLCAVVTRRLKLPMQLSDEPWDDIFGAKDNCTSYFEEHLLDCGEPLVLVLDHVDRLFDAPTTAQETLALLRAWHEMGKCRPPWDRLRLVLAYSTEMYLPLHINHSPFNVGLPVVLGEWDDETVLDLARRHGLTWERAEVERLCSLIGGHPHLVRMALYHIASGMSLNGLLATAATDEGLFADHLRYLLWHVQCVPALRDAMARVMESPAPVRLGTEVAFKLVSLGVGHLQGNAVRPARELYRRYFNGRLRAATA